MTQAMRWLATALAALTFSAAQAAIVPGGRLFVVEENVDIVITFIGGGGAGNSNTLYLESPAGIPDALFNNHTSGLGSTFNLGPFAAGTELIFRVESDDGDGIDSWYTGPASANSDNLIHAIVDDDASDFLVDVFFEDLPNEFSPNYDDMNFSINNVRVEPVPLPAALVLFASGFAGLCAARRRARS